MKLRNKQTITLHVTIVLKNIIRIILKNIYICICYTCDFFVNILQDIWEDYKQIINNILTTMSK